MRRLMPSASAAVALLVVAGCGWSGSHANSTGAQAVSAAEAKAAFQALGLHARVAPGTRYNLIPCNGDTSGIGSRFVYMAAALVRPFRYQDTLTAVAYKNAAAAEACAQSVVKPQYVIALTGGVRGTKPKVVRINSTTQDVTWPAAGNVSSGQKGVTGSWLTVFTNGPVMMFGIAANRSLSERLQAQMRELAPKLVH